MLAFAMGCSKETEEPIVPEEKLLFDITEYIASPYRDNQHGIDFTCENSKSWSISTITEIIGDSTENYTFKELEEAFAEKWFEISKNDSILNVKIEENLFNKERRLIIQIESDSKQEEVSLELNQISYPDFSVEDTVEKSKLTGRIWYYYGVEFRDENREPTIGPALEFLENGILRSYRNYPDDKNSFTDIKKFRITKDYFYYEDLLVEEDRDNPFGSIFHLKRKIYTYKFYENKFHIDLKYGMDLLIYPSFDTFISFDD